MRRRLTRAATLATAAGVLGLGLGGCAAYARGVAHHELTIVFTPTFTTADVHRVLRACDGVGGARAKPAVGSKRAADRRYPLHFDVTGLTSQQQAALTTCLAKDPAVVGVADSSATQ